MNDPGDGFLNSKGSIASHARQSFVKHGGGLAEQGADAAPVPVQSSGQRLLHHTLTDEPCPCPSGIRKLLLLCPASRGCNRYDLSCAGRRVHAGLVNADADADASGMHFQTCSQHNGMHRDVHRCGFARRALVTIPTVICWTRQSGDAVHSATVLVQPRLPLV